MTDWIIHVYSCTTRQLYTMQSCAPVPNIESPPSLSHYKKQKSDEYDVIKRLGRACCSASITKLSACDTAPCIALRTRPLSRHLRLIRTVEAVIVTHFRLLFPSEPKGLTQPINSVIDHTATPNTVWAINPLPRTLGGSHIGPRFGCTKKAYETSYPAIIYISGI